LDVAAVVELEDLTFNVFESDLSPHILCINQQQTFTRLCRITVLIVKNEKHSLSSREEDSRKETGYCLLLTIVCFFCRIFFLENLCNLESALTLFYVRELTQGCKDA